jgi:Flp pilus assembly protein TadG
MTGRSDGVRQRLMDQPLDWLRRLRADVRGATAVEFAAVAGPFLFMIFAILQLALVFIVNVTLDNAVATEGRKFMTGQECIDSASDTAAVNNLKNNICGNMSWLGSQCATNLNVDVRSYSSFSGTSFATPTKTVTVNGAAVTELDTSQIQDTSGGPSSINVITAYYTWPLFLPVLYGGLENLPNSGQHLLISKDVLSFEPYPTGSANCTLG